MQCDTQPLSKEGERATVTCRVFHALGQSTEEGPTANTNTTKCLYRDWLECVVGGDIYIMICLLALCVVGDFGAL